MEDLQPISWRVWAGKVEREGKRMGRVNPWAGLEERVGFVDIRVCRSCSYISLIAQDSGRVEMGSAGGDEGGEMPLKWI